MVYPGHYAVIGDLCDDFLKWIVKKDVLAAEIYTDCTGKLLVEVVCIHVTTLDRKVVLVASIHDHGDVDGDTGRCIQARWLYFKE